MDYFRLNKYYTRGPENFFITWFVANGRILVTGPTGPFAYDGKDNQPHPDTPAPYNEIGPVDGSFGPLVNIEGRTTKDGKPLAWRTGGWQSVDKLTIHPSGENDPTPDEKMETGPSNNCRHSPQQMQRIANLFMGMALSDLIRH